MNELKESFWEMKDPLHFWDRFVGVQMTVEGVLIFNFLST